MPAIEHARVRTVAAPDERTLIGPSAGFLARVTRNTALGPA